VRECSQAAPLLACRRYAATRRWHRMSVLGYSISRVREETAAPRIAALSPAGDTE
jgi:hypothetical protein